MMLVLGPHLVQCPTNPIPPAPSSQVDRPSSAPAGVPPLTWWFSGETDLAPAYLFPEASALEETLAVDGLEMRRRGRS